MKALVPKATMQMYQVMLDSDDQEDDNLTCLENKIINEDNQSNVDSTLGLDKDKFLNILGQKRNDFWCSSDYTIDWYKKISNIYLKNDILKEINDKFVSSDDVASLFLCLSSFPTAYEVLSKNPLMIDLSRSLYGVQAKICSPVKPLISILEYSRDDRTKNEIISVIQML